MGQAEPLDAFGQSLKDDLPSHQLIWNLTFWGLDDPFLFKGPSCHFNWWEAAVTFPSASMDLL